MEAEFKTSSPASEESGQPDRVDDYVRSSKPRDTRFDVTDRYVVRMRSARDDDDDVMLRVDGARVRGARRRRHCILVPAAPVPRRSRVAVRRTWLPAPTAASAAEVRRAV